MRIVLDTNILVSAVISRRGPPAQLQTAWRRGDFELVTSRPLLTELERVLLYPHILRVTGRTVGEVLDLVANLRTTATIVDPTQRFAVSRDPNDDRVLEAAYAAHAEYIVSGDRDLLELREFWGIPIVTPAVFVRLLGQ